MAQITLNEGLAWLKTLKKRHEELITLRDGNTHRERRFYGASADKEIVNEPVYDVKALDRSVTRVAREIRLLEQALKATNAKTVVEAYDQDDAALGELTQRERSSTRIQGVWGSRGGVRSLVGASP
jgi:hypothetical protein